MSTLPELQDIEAAITKLRAERDELGGALVMLLEAVMGEAVATTDPRVLANLSDLYSGAIRKAVLGSGMDPEDTSAHTTINALAATVRRLTQDSLRPQFIEAGAVLQWNGAADEKLNDLDAYGFVMDCAPGDARSATDPDGRAFTWDRSGD